MLRATSEDQINEQEHQVKDYSASKENDRHLFQDHVSQALAISVKERTFDMAVQKKMNTVDGISDFWAKKFISG
ncbi:hypothetical protein PoMZ_11526 [Pyricularia oryzae]|uniref:Uncharacterized protein n=1 Tax=Pyricularia oryzae TaxID=318829 RepID=A0A4P7NKM1_PYROR|nr:hypothetical protein PoMZ_11526 [Pyricularia oryzae]